MDSKLKGTLCGIVAAVSYGCNPLGALFLYQEGLHPNTVIFYRFAFAAALLALVLIATRKDMLATRKELSILATLGVLFGISSMSLYYSFGFMDAGIACTILFVYPVMVAVIMAACFGERLTSATVTSIVLALTGIALLYQGDGQIALSTSGVLLVLLSSLTYAVYIVVVNKSPLRMSTVKLNFYVLLFCMATIALFSYTSGNALQAIPTVRALGFEVFLALVPTVVSLLTMVVAVHNVGSTPTAIMGALEPLTAVIIGISVFGEHFSVRLGLGIALILVAVVLIILGKRFQPLHFVSRVGHAGMRVLRKSWRWR